MERKPDATKRCKGDEEEYESDEVWERSRLNLEQMKAWVGWNSSVTKVRKRLRLTLTLERRTMAKVTKAWGKLGGQEPTNNSRNRVHLGHEERRVPWFFVGAGRGYFRTSKEQHRAASSYCCTTHVCSSSRVPSCEVCHGVLRSDADGKEVIRFHAGGSDNE